MSVRYRLSGDDLLKALEDWDTGLRGSVLLVACGGTALSLDGYKESTKDVDFLIPDPAHLTRLEKLLPLIGYSHRGGCNWMHPSQPWIFQLWRGQRIFQTELLDPVQKIGNHRVVKRYKRLTLGRLNTDDLIISKMFRGDGVDVQDSIVLLKAEKLDLLAFANRYKETAEYYFNTSLCKKNFGYLIDAMELEGIETAAVREVFEQWKE